MSVDAGLRAEVAELLADYATYIDEDRLEDWLDFFADEAEYHIRPRENIEQNYPVAIMSCPNRNALCDRISILRNASKYNIHTDRHLLGPSRITEEDGGILAVDTPFALYQTDADGQSKLLCVGTYRDKLVRQRDKLRFRQKTVVLDTSSIPTLIATPV
jgi:3-phenylpropionate/cinnamic acid dioxygenase small subunit